MFPIHRSCNELSTRQASDLILAPPALQNTGTQDDVDALSRKMCKEISSILPAAAEVQRFQKILTSVFQEKMSSLSEEMKQHCADFQFLTAWVEAAQKATSIEEFPEFNKLPEHMREMFYKAVWMMCGKVDEFNFGGNKCQENPFLLRDGCSPILHARGLNLLEQSICHFADEGNLLRDKLLLSQLEVFTAAAEKLSDRSGVKNLFCLLDPILQNEVLATQREEANSHTYWGFGETEIKNDSLRLLEVKREKIPSSLLEAYDRKDGSALKERYESLCDAEKAILANDVYESFIGKKSQELVFTKLLSRNESFKNSLAAIIKKRELNLTDSKNDIKQRQSVLPKEMQGVINLSLIKAEERTSSTLAEGLKTLSCDHPCIEKLCSNIQSLSPCQLMTPGDMDDAAVLTDVMKRGKALALLHSFIDNLSSKYPSIAHAANDTQHKVYELFQRLCLTCLIKPSFELDSKWQSFFATLLEMQKEDLTDLDALLILERAMSQLTSSPLKNHLVDAIALRSLVAKTVQDIRDGSLIKGHESYLKPIYKVSTQEGAMAKFKAPDPNASNAMKNELASYELDNICALGVTQPIARCRQKDLENVLHMHITLQQWMAKQAESFPSESNKDHVLKEIAALDPARCDFAQKLMQLKEKITKIDDAKENRQVFDDMSLKMEEAIANLPSGAKRWLVQTIHTHFAPSTIGVTEENLPLQWKENKLLSSEVKRQVLQNALAGGHSEQYNGVVQLWIQGHIERAYDLLMKNQEEGHQKISQISKGVAHLHILSGILKGSQDVSSGNAMLTFSEDGTMITSIKEFDDEYGLPQHKELRFSDFRLWQMGLPQSKQPFDRSFMRVFCCKEAIGQIERALKAMGMEREGISASERLRRVQELFVAELNKAGPSTLSPRKLFFTLFGGQETVQWHQNENPHISDIEIFEHKLRTF